MNKVFTVRKKRGEIRVVDNKKKIYRGEVGFPIKDAVGDKDQVGHK
jgi:hypothetical protein